jgi:hypothetical protein
VLPAVAVVLTGCSTAVDVRPPDPAVDADACGTFMAALPDTLVDQQARPTEPTSPLTAAWGDPAITLRCAVPDPQALTPTSQLVSIDGVDWFPEELTAGYAFTTYGRSTNVEVVVPDDYSPEADAVTLLSPMVKRTIPLKRSARD